MNRVIAILAIILTLLPTPGSSQGWVADIDIEVNHDNYAFEAISEAILTYSGLTQHGASGTSNLSFSVNGQGTVAGDIQLIVKGFAWEPYNRQNPPEEALEITFSGHYDTPCEIGFFEEFGETSLIQIYVWIRIHPRMEISLQQQCDRLMLTSHTCADSYRWELSDNLLGDFKELTGKSASNILITAEDLTTIGFTTNPYGRKYFRVTGVEHTTSEILPVDIYYPGPVITIDSSPPRCHDGADGVVSIDIVSALPSEIDDFVVTLFGSNHFPIVQEYLQNSHNLNLSELSQGTYTVRVENNTNLEVLGSCWSEHSFSLVDPDPVTISAKLSNYHGYETSCAGTSDGEIHITGLGGTGVFDLYKWTPAVSDSSTAENLAAGTYQIRIRDTNGCWSDEYAYAIRTPKQLDVQLTSIGGLNGFDVSCHDKADGVVRTEITGGVAPYSFAWSNGASGSLISGVTQGPYDVLVTDANGCTQSESIRLVAPAPIEFQITELQRIECAGASTGVLEVSSMENTIGNIYVLWSTGETVRRVTGKKAGTYSVRVSDGQGCTTTAEYTLKEPGNVNALVTITSDYNGSAISCFGSSDGSAEVNLQDDQGNPLEGEYYVWYYNGQEIFASSHNRVNSLGAGTYEVIVTYNGECLARASNAITAPPAVNVEITGPPGYNGIPIACDDSGVTLHARASGGSGPPYSFLWDTGATSQNLFDAKIGHHTVEVVDANGCKAMTSEEVPSATLNLGDSATICPGETYVLDPGPGWTNYEWGSDHGFSSHERTISAMDAGRYWLTASTPTGCSVRDTFLLKTSNELLHAEFLVPSNAMIFDTLVAIDVSYPIPESSAWLFPPQMTMFDSNGDRVMGMFVNPGSYQIALTVTRGKCRDELSKTITIVGEDQSSPNGRSKINSFVERFEVYPNPVTGPLHVKVALEKTSAITLTVTNIMTSQIVAHQTLAGSEYYETEIDLGSLSAGLYNIRLDYFNGSVQQKLIVR